MRYTWRFFVDPDGRWRWQQVGDDRIIISESATSFGTYESCVDAATGTGYVFEKAQGRVVRPGNDRFPRK
jgi:hypothetical protein